MPELVAGGANPDAHTFMSDPTGRMPERLRGLQGRIRRAVDDVIPGVLVSTGSSVQYSLAPNQTGESYRDGPPNQSMWRWTPHVESANSPTLRIGDSERMPLVDLSGAAIRAGALGPLTVVVVRTDLDSMRFTVVTALSSEGVSTRTVKAIIDQRISVGQPITRQDGSSDERVGLNRLNTLAMPVGTIAWYGADPLIQGWLPCDGREVSRATFALLFGVIGVRWGTGDGTTTFNLPDLRGRVPLGAGVGSGLTARALGATGGSETHVLTEAEIAAHSHSGSVTITGGAHSHTASSTDAGEHTHTPNLTVTAVGGHTHSISARLNFAGGTLYRSQISGFRGASVNPRASGAEQANTGSAGGHTHSVTGTISDAGSHSHSVTVDESPSHDHEAVLSMEAGVSEAHNNVQPSIVLSAIIKAG